MSILTIDCSRSSTAQTLVAAVEAGELWGVNMGTTSKVSVQSDHVLIECTTTRNLALLDACPAGDTYTIVYSISNPDTFTQTDAISRSWYLRGKL